MPQMYSIASILEFLRNYKGLDGGFSSTVSISTDSMRAGIGRIFELVDCREVLIRA